MIILDEEITIDFSNMGHFIGGADWIHPDTVTSTYELVFVTEGEVFLEIADVKYHFVAGDLFCIPAGHRRRGWRSSNAPAFFWLHFFAENYDRLGITSRRIKDIHNYALFFKQLNHFATLQKEKNLIECKLVAFLLELKNSVPEKSKLFSDVCEYVRIHISEDLTVKEVAARFHYSSDYLSKVFFKNIGLSLKEYLDRERNAFIKNLLLSTMMSLKEIAEAAGFEDDNRLIKFFKYNNRTTPTLFRNRYYASHINNK